jgi:ATP-dependent DNA ligase
MLTYADITFDILHADGESLFDRPLVERRKILESKIYPEKDHFDIVPQTPITSSAQVYKALDDAISDG